MATFTRLSMSSYYPSKRKDCLVSAEWTRPPQEAKDEPYQANIQMKLRSLKKTMALYGLVACAWLTAPATPAEPEAQEKQQLTHAEQLLSDLVIEMYALRHGDGGEEIESLLQKYALGRRTPIIPPEATAEQSFERLLHLTKDLL